MKQHEPQRQPAVAAPANEDLGDLDAPLRRELDELFSDPNVDRYIREARDAAYAIGIRHPA